MRLRREVYRVRWYSGRHHSEVARGKRAAKDLLWRAMTDHSNSVVLSEVVKERTTYVDIDSGSTESSHSNGYKRSSKRITRNV